MLTLLIVDDEVLIADGLRDMLAKAFASRLNVICRYSAAAAVEAVSGQGIDILLTDINMPFLSGLELLAVTRIPLKVASVASSRRRPSLSSL